jgi:hypothetical protein
VKRRFQLTARAWPSCLLRQDESERVRATQVTVELDCYQMGRRNRDKMVILAMKRLQAVAPQFFGCPQSVGGLTCGEPVEVKGGAEKRLVIEARREAAA